MPAPPQLTFPCELGHARLAELFADPAVVDDLLALKARVALMCSDFSDQRAGVVQRLNAAGIPVTGIPLLPLAEGYYFTVDNAGRAAGSYQEFAAWTRRHRLVWDGVGLDIEPDACTPRSCARWGPGCSGPTGPRRRRSRWAPPAAAPTSRTHRRCRR